MKDVAYQYLLQNNQETCYPCFTVSRHYYSRAEAEEACCTEHCFRLVRRISESRIEGELAYHVVKAQRRHEKVKHDG